MPRSANATGASCECGSVIGPSKARRSGDEAPRNAERSLDLGAQCAHAEGLGGVVPGVQYGDPELLRLDGGVMGPLPHDERVHLRSFRLTQRLARRTGAGADGPARRSAFGSHTNRDELSTLSARHL